MLPFPTPLGLSVTAVYPLELVRDNDSEHTGQPHLPKVEDGPGQLSPRIRIPVEADSCADTETTLGRIACARHL